MHGLCGDRMLRAHRNFSDVDLRSVKDPKTFGVQMKQYLMILARIHANEQAQSYCNFCLLHLFATSVQHLKSK